ncbi:restriction endonuclease subunit S [Listeria innocua]|uniref:restriction endonuclease subunit S n=2 Tax=Listeria innocua TaxID=1642 RepID=UPI00138906C7|nr:restriction endonuclease subunit S [Listeria innocua]EDO1222194.1 restriction endonuclease subunit S [Listeria innocua]EIU0522736.1 restriction endonuclease subunit S [Listeria innocua]EKD7158779.1 restriction endonuclease subunit S [Listeria innocua]EKK7200387.1 restriction endonuclease subunit S [Listeria innocua]EKM1334843.1 restriction endonuclease subunit S [Listeria innocua]
MKKLEKSVPVIRFKGFSEAWEQRKLRDIANYRNGKAHEQVEDEDGKYTIINSKFISTNGKVQRYTNEQVEPIFDGEIAMVLSDLPNGKALAKLFLVKEDGKYTLNQRIAGITPNENIDPIFLNFRMNRNNYFLKFDSGVTQTNLSKSQVENFIALYPTFDEQYKIGLFFTQLDDTIALHQRKLDALKLMKKAFSQQIFPENNRKKPKIRFTSFYEEWEQRKIGEYGYFYYGKSAPKWSVAQDATTPCVRYGELYTKFGPEIDIVHSYTNIDKSNLKFSSGNEVLVPRVGENPLDFANCSWLSISNVAIGEMISVYNTEQYPLFIAYYFRSKMKYEFAKRVEGGNVSNLYYSYLEDILISVPSIEEQKKIAEFLNKIDITINLLQNKLGRIKELKKAYLQNMFI